jgi:hypothetical protein
LHTLLAQAHQRLLMDGQPESQVTTHGESVGTQPAETPSAPPAGSQAGGAGRSWCTRLGAWLTGAQSP